MSDLPEITPLAAPLDDLATGLYRMEARHYHASYGVSKSRLDDLAQHCPAVCKYRQDHPEAETEAMRIGHWTHLAVLEPDEFAKRAAVSDLDNRRGNNWKIAKEAAATFGQELFLRPEHDEIAGLAASVRAHPLCREILEVPGAAEVSAFAEDEETGMQLRSRFDWLPAAGNALADLKTCACASSQAFGHAVADGRYHAQAAFYLDQANRLGLDRDTFVFIAVEKEPPYPVAVYQLGAAEIEEGRRLYRADLMRYLQCSISGKWPGYGDDLQMLSLPPWAFKR